MGNAPVTRRRSAIHDHALNQIAALPEELSACQPHIYQALSETLGAMKDRMLSSPNSPSPSPGFPGMPESLGSGVIWGASFQRHR